MSFQIHTLGFFLGKKAHTSMKKLLLAILAAIILTTPQNAFAQEKASASSAKIVSDTETNAVFDSRVQILRSYLESRNSPLAENAEDFVFYADKYNLDWKLVAAIAGVESSFGLAIPNNSYNAWGWGVYGDNVIRFASWKEGIGTISQGLREKYMNRWGAKNIYEIGRIYASSQAWPNSVQIHLNSIQKFALNDARSSLSLSF
ncbi:MAG: hypothetical protein A3B38_01280 [Candidatus Levybacteria bacterium RIFCSPLOWO2_01_FULL_36_13]|nr:MAG: hypothetical protein A2684_02515 [Candidatus Levybacteria bacterium RIFCSPHIGHO2_01_FULL_36_15b]OGH35516.1 MAG: hypothetical protein A3B38_01280 [Candidatus Levybacteria bacterium RIFCSPLOWO2_01_FULL_36_13]